MPCIDAYVAPQLTATGGGVAATGDLTASMSAGSSPETMSSSVPAVAATTPATTQAATTKAAVTKAATTAKAASSAAGAATTVTVQAAAASNSNGASDLAVPALGGILAFAGAISALL